MTKTNITTLVDSILKDQTFGKDFKFRPNQRETVENICNHYLEDPNGTVVIDAPTGTGKSIIAMWCSYILKHLGNQGYIITSDKMLQSQYEKDFMTYKLDWPSVKGVDNYECDVNGLPFSVGECKMRGYSHAQSESLPCARTCDYLNARKKAIDRPVTLLNYSFWLIQQNYVNRRLAQKQSEKDNDIPQIGGPMALNAELDLDQFDNFFPFKKRDFCFFDEAHKVDEIVQEHFSPFFKKISLFSTVTLIEFLVGEGIETPNISKSYMESLIQSILTDRKSVV